MPNNNIITESKTNESRVSTKVYGIIDEPCRFGFLYPLQSELFTRYLYNIVPTMTGTINAVIDKRRIRGGQYEIRLTAFRSASVAVVSHRI